jgi:hypothetical protein
LYQISGLIRKHVFQCEKTDTSGIGLQYAFWKQSASFGVWPKSQISSFRDTAYLTNENLQQWAMLACFVDLTFNIETKQTKRMLGIGITAQSIHPWNIPRPAFYPLHF